MDVLRILWVASWLLGIFSLIWMTSLVVARVFRDGAETKRQQIYKSVIDAYLRLMRDDLTAFDDLRRNDRHARILAEALLEILDMVRGSQRDYLVESLAAFGLDRTLRQRARSGPAAARLAAIEALASFPGEKTEDVLRLIVHTAGGPLRIAAAKSLVTMGLPIDLDLLVRDMIVHKEAWSGSLSDVLSILAERQPSDCVRVLERADLPEALRAMVAEAMGGSTDYTVVPALAESALKGSATVRAAALRALGRLQHPVVEQVVARSFADEDWRVRGAAAGAAGGAGLKGLIPRLAERLVDPVWWVRFQAAEALMRLGPDGRKALQKLAKSGPDAAARAASLTLAEWKQL